MAAGTVGKGERKRPSRGLELGGVRCNMPRSPSSPADGCLKLALSCVNIARPFFLHGCYEWLEGEGLLLVWKFMLVHSLAQSFRTLLK